MCRLNLFILLFLVSLFTGCFPGSEPHKKDNELIGKFITHKEQFNQLLQILQKNCDVNQNFEKSLKISDGESAKYKKLYKEIGFSEESFGNCLNDGVEFVDTVQGLAVSGSSKGYVFLGINPKNLTDNLDIYRHSNNDSYTVYRNVEGNWYLFFQYDN